MSDTISAIPTPDKGFLYSAEGGVILDFSVNPAQLQRQEQATFNTSLSPGAPGAFVQYTGGGERNVTFELVLDAIGTKAGDRAVPAGSILHTVTETDRIDNLSYQYYGTPDFWWYILDKNPGVDALDLPVGKQIWIPPLPQE